MTMADDGSSIRHAANKGKEKDPPELQQEAKVAMNQQESTNQAQIIENNEDEPESSSSLANAFVVGTNLSLSPSRDSNNDNNNVNPPTLIVEEEEEDTAISLDAAQQQQEEMTPTRALAASEHSLMDDDEEEDSNDDSDDKNQEETNDAKQEEAKTNESSPSSGTGAKILMNRFSSWREKANEAMKTNRFGNNNTKKEQEDHSDISEASGGQISASSSNESSAGSSFTRENDESVATNDKQQTLEEEYAETQRRAAVAVKVAASSVVDTVASGFRGRYSGGGNAPTPEPAKERNNKQQTMTQSQTSLIMQSRAKAHMQSILDSLEPQEYVMLLGNGMLGVNLKQAYLKNNGVYIDYLVEGGSAEMSGVVCVGDNLMKVGDVDVFRKGLILNVPQTIASAKRPVVLVLSAGQEIPLERMNYIDVAVGMMHRIREEKKGHRDIASLPIQDDEPSSGEANTPDAKPDDSTDKETPTAAEKKTTDVTVPTPSFDGPNPMNITTPPLELRELVSPFVAKRCYDQFSLSMLCQAATTDANFRAVLQNAFVTCVYDGRRLPFLSSHFSYQESFDNGDDSGSEADVQMTTASTQLMLFLELTTFIESYSITPDAKRRDIAKRIAFKFFLPTKIGNTLEPPMFDFHDIVPDSDLRALEHALNDAENPVGQNIFVPFQRAVMESLSGPPFLTFLISVECARMRAYLRNTAPFQTICPGEIFAGVEEKVANMENHLQYMALHLICQVEREIGDEHDGLNGDSQERVMGAVGGMACAVYIKTRLLNAIKAAKAADEAESSSDNDGPYYDLIEAMEVVWETFVAPAGGMLDNVSNSAETEIALKKVRELLNDAVLGYASSSADASRDEETIKALTTAELVEAFSSLADHLLYDYSVNSYSKFKEHRFHEWLCNEVTAAEGDNEATLELQPGCIRRLIRKAQLPSGVSPHKPIRPSAPQSAPATASPIKGDTTLRINEDSNNTATQCRNAEFAIVFGTDDGSGEVDPEPSPAMNRTDIRRYTCQAVVDDEVSPGASSFRVPQTLESYVTVPLLRHIPFAKSADDSRISDDGWEVSLVNFMVPNADTSSDSHDEKSLYGVSLVFQKRGKVPVQASKAATKIELVQEATPSMEARTPQKPPSEESSDVPHFASPIRFASPSAEAAERPEAGASTATRVIQVSMASPEFNRRLQETSWSGRMEERKRVVSGPVTVGIALACRRNVVLAMRETLTQLLLDHSKSTNVSEQGLVCGPLVELLGNFSHPDVEATALKAILEPYLSFGSATWIDRPIQDQKHHFDTIAGQQLIDCLPPIPLALLFVTLMLEQKVVLSSSRRSVLFSAVTSLTQLLSPLHWSHLLVPLVPSALARDLLQYPAPFILGIPSEDPGNMEALNSLPSDVTLVDLDVGRVILASHFAHDEELVRGDEDPRITAAALRSQVLYLAQSLGLLFGSRLRKQTWNVDSPSTSFALEDPQAGMSDIEKLRAVCRSFLVELLTGTESCCFWIEESQNATEGQSQSAQTECTVLFDEDRFFHIKNLRAGGKYKPLFQAGSPFQRKHVNYDVDGPMASDDSLALSLDDFDLILETFLRCQSMSTFVSSRPKGRMAYV